MILVVGGVTLLASCDRSVESKKESFDAARQGFVTQLTRIEKESFPAPESPPMMFDSVKYPGPLGEMSAYVGADPRDGKKHPAIIWLVGGFGNSISDIAWTPGERENDQSAASFRKAGIITMYPSLRGGNDSPGQKEGLYGEVDDVIAAAEYLKTLDYIDPDFIYLGGHSVGGTLALLAAERSELFRATISLGPVESTAFYGEENVPFDINGSEETRLRSPIEWLHCLSSPTFIFEGNDGNIDSLNQLQDAGKRIRFVKAFGVPGTHFSIIRPLSDLFAAKIHQDHRQGAPASTITFTPAEVKHAAKYVLPPPRPSYPVGSPLADRISFQYAIYYLKEPEQDLVKVCQEVLAASFLNLKWRGENADLVTDEMTVSAFLETEVAKNYAPPSLEQLEYCSKGLSEEQKLSLQGAQHALIINFSHPQSKSFSALRASVQFVEELIKSHGGIAWDEVTREVFSQQQWRENRIEYWQDDLPNVLHHITVHAYRDGENLRAISLGMEKFGAPDIIVDQFASSNFNQVVTLINFWAQSMAEGATIDVSGGYDFDLNDIQYREMREKELASIIGEGKGRVRLQLGKGPWDFGDPLNRLMEITFAHAEGVDLFAKQDALLMELFGSDDSVSYISHDEAIKTASAEARKRLPALRETFLADSKPGSLLLLKAPFETPDGGNEWMWIEVSDWSAEEAIRGTLQNQPANIPELDAGQQVTIRTAEVFDYLLKKPDGSEEGNETGRIILEMESE